MDYLSHVQRPFCSWKEYLAGVLLSLVISSLSGSALVLAAAEEPNLLLMAVLLITAFLLGLVLTGYTLRCGMTKGKLPEWHWKLYLPGLKGIIVGIVYSLPFFFVMYFNYGAALFTSELPQDITGGTVLAMVIGILTIYIIPVALLRMMKTSFSGGFDISAVVEKAWSTQYLFAFVIAFLYGLLVLFVFSAITIKVQLLPAVGSSVNFLLTAFVGMALRITTMSMYGEAVHEGH